MAPAVATKTQGMTPREYAVANGLALQTVYLQLWEGRLKAEQILGRWLIHGRKESE